MSDVPEANAAALIDVLVNQPVPPGWEANQIQPKSCEALWRVYANYHPDCKYSDVWAGEKIS
jgi:hypothetical protein